MNFRGPRSADEAFRLDTEQFEGLELDIGELRWDGRFLFAQQLVAFDVVERSRDLLSGWPLSDAAWCKSAVL